MLDRHLRALLICSTLQLYIYFVNAFEDGGGEEFVFSLHHQCFAVNAMAHFRMEHFAGNAKRLPRSDLKNSS